MNIVEDLEGLVEQATKERSHYYIKSVAEKAIAKIKSYEECEFEWEQCRRREDSLKAQIERLDWLVKDRTSSFHNYREMVHMNLQVIEDLREKLKTAEKFINADDWDEYQHDAAHSGGKK